MKKRIIIITSILICFLLVFSILLSIYISNNQKITVLTYHNIGTKQDIENNLSEKPWTIDIENFEEHLKMLKKHNFKTLTLEEFYKWKKGEIRLPYKSILITFDDGFYSNYYYAFKLLKKYDMNATVFLIGNYMEDKNEDWNGNLKTYISKEILEKCKTEYPNIEFASHTYALHEHDALEKSSLEDLYKDAKMFKENVINTDYIAYPFGKNNENFRNALKENNYKMAFIFGPSKKEYRKASRKDNDFLIPRLNTSFGMNPTKLLFRLLMPF